MTGLKRFSVGPVEAGLRLDRALVELAEGWSRSRIRSWIDQGRVERNGRSARQSERVAEGDVLTVDVPPVEPSAVEAEDIPLSILYEDDHLLLIDKPAGLVIHPAAGNPDGTLVNALLHHCKDLSGIGGVERPGIVHRLDKDTTGVMVVAKSDGAHLGLSLAFSRREIAKTYLGVCYGVPRDREGVIDQPIGRHHSERKKMAVREDGQPARTLYEVAETFAGTALIQCRLVTGRTHQIRVHFAHLGHALVGDALYSGRQWRNLRDPRHQHACRDFPRQALHARSLAFTHPVTNEHIAFEAPIPDDLAELLRVLRTAP